MKHFWKIGFAVVLLGLFACHRGENEAEPATIVVNWATDYAAALERAKQEDRRVLVNFTGSDWCPPCIQLKRDALSQRRFLEFAETNLVLLEIDFPQRTPLPQALARQNDELHSRFLISGFPTLVLLDPGGRELGRHIGYLPGGPEALVRWVSKERN